MATRSIKLKIALGRGENLRDVRQAIWATHEVFNDGVRYYMTWLMRLRQQPIADPDAPKDDILPLAREAQERNGKPDRSGTDDEIKTLLRRLYEEMVPSAVGKSGDANHIGSDYLSVLVDPKSIGGMGKSPTGRRPVWKSMPPGPDRDAREQASRQRRQKGLEQSARPPLKRLGILPLFEPFSKTRGTWTRLTARSRDDAALTTWDRDMFQQALERLMSWESWNLRVQQEFHKKCERLASLRQRYLQGDPTWHRQLCQYEESRKTRLDAEALASDRRFRITPRMIRGWDRLREQWLRVPAQGRTDSRLCAIVAELQTELRGRFGDASDFYPWLAHPENHLLWDESGDREAVRVHVALNEAERAVEAAKEFANYTPPESVLHPLWTRSDVPGGGSNFHKYSLSDEDGNLRATVRLLSSGESGGIVERDWTLSLRPSGQWNRPQRGTEPQVQVVPFKSVPEGWRTGKKNDEKCTWVRVLDAGADSPIYGTLGQARLQLDRGDFRVRGSNPEKALMRRKAFSSGERFPRAYLNITINLPDLPKPPAVTALHMPRPKLETDFRAVTDYHISSERRASETSQESGATKALAIGDITPGGSTMAEGMRVLSVDLGLRKFASCAVFELVSRPADGKAAIPIHGTDGLWMEHRRSFAIALPGEDVTPEQREQRRKIREDRLVMRAAVARLSRLLSLGRHDDPEKRRVELEALKGQAEWEEDERRRAIDAILSPAVLEPLAALVDRAKDLKWPEAVIAAHRKWEEALGRAIHDWRVRGRSRHRDPASRGYGGLSYWHIEELEETRKLLNAWSCHSRDYEQMRDSSRRPMIVRSKQRFSGDSEPRKQDRDTDVTLLEHINNLKEDRLKVGADRIVNAALGFEYEGLQKGWVRHHAPCQLVLFEDLSRYLFKTGRPRRENSMLMKWGHREIPRTVAMQGEIHGLAVGKVSAEFTSQYRASGDRLTPGIRCQLLTAEDVGQPWFAQEIKRFKERNPDAPIPVAGQMIRQEGGEWFVTLNRNGTLYRVNADINASQNIMRRFWTRYSEIIRITCRRLSDDTWGPKTIGKRLGRAVEAELGAKAFRLERIGSGDGEAWRWVHATAKAAGLAARDRKADEAEADEIDAAEEEIAEARGEVANFFRDPSGIVIPLVDGVAPWLQAKAFWGRVRTVIEKRLGSPPSTEAPEDDFPY